MVLVTYSLGLSADRRSTSLGVQRAIAEIFIRSGARAATPELATMLRQRRIRSPDGDDLIEVLIRMLQQT